LSPGAGSPSQPQVLQHNSASAAMITGGVLGPRTGVRRPIWSSGNGGGGNTAILQTSVKDQNVPPEVRLNFVKKVYSIMAAMLCVSFSVATPFVFRKVPTLIWMSEHQWVTVTVNLFVLANILLNIAIRFEWCIGGSTVRTAYINMFKRTPWNYMYLTTYALCFGVCIGYICAQYEVTSVVFAFAMTAGIMLCLTIYAVYTKTDFTGTGLYILVLICGLVMLGVVMMFFPGVDVLNKIYAIGASVLMCWIIIFDTQLIFGTASFQFNRVADRSVEYTLDMYAFASFQLYLDFINMFVWLLRFVGSSAGSLRGFIF